MNNVLIIPTGIGAEIGGHSGDGNPVAKLIASVSDTLITHPNVVNAADINEMTDNTLYVEGGILDNFLEGKIGLNKVRSNRILVVANKPIPNELVNSVSAARCTLGADIKILGLDTPLLLTATMVKKVAAGNVSGVGELIEQVIHYDFDALAIASPIKVDNAVRDAYLKGEIETNPWGGVEAVASRTISDILMKPVAHAPIESEDMREYNEVGDPRIGAELVSISYIHCVLKGLHKAPRVETIDPSRSDLTINDVDCLITPGRIFGRPHQACVYAKIPVIAVMGNHVVLNRTMPSEFILVDNYLEAVGVIQSIKEGISLKSVKRPILKTEVING